MPGAVRLAGEGALRVGAGMVSIATHPEVIVAILTLRPELMVFGILTPRELAPLLEKASVIVVGPGLGLDAQSKSLYDCVLDSEKPKIFDADALSLLAQSPSRSDNWILTPHPGEAARLLQCKPADIQANRLESVQTIQRRYGGVVVLKGMGTLVAASNSLGLCQAGNPGVSSPGMGDVLSGVIGGLLAQGLSLQQAAELGVCLHATAGDLAAQALGERGLLAGDLMPYLHRLVNPVF